MNRGRGSHVPVALLVAVLVCGPGPACSPHILYVATGGALSPRVLFNTDDWLSRSVVPGRGGNGQGEGHPAPILEVAPPARCR